MTVQYCPRFKIMFPQDSVSIAQVEVPLQTLNTHHRSNRSNRPDRASLSFALEHPVVRCIGGYHTKLPLYAAQVTLCTMMTKLRLTLLLLLRATAPTHAFGVVSPPPSSSSSSSTIPTRQATTRLFGAAAAAAAPAAPMAEAGIPPTTSASTDVEEIDIPTNLPSAVGMDYIPLATMLASGQLAEADQVRWILLFVRRNDVICGQFRWRECVCVPRVTSRCFPPCRLSSPASCLSVALAPLTQFLYMVILESLSLSLSLFNSSHATLSLNCLDPKPKDGTLYISRK